MKYGVVIDAEEKRDMREVLHKWTHIHSSRPNEEGVGVDATRGSKKIM